ncbi:hypothetical protein [Paenibacillus tyrfis]|uniref:hypothetical protein n=1 Tax=Paenibacillus tyrfis TaxID=1501230 RepID=UPI00209DD467|nr:hypothetical protein [Paenibacillus tyrfis]MCP1306410.1 hypothetical protein [Paenibacillus tyrfis]
MDNIIVLDTIRLDRNQPRKCTCGDGRTFRVDTVNREITCDCGLIVDPFEAMEYLAAHYDRLNREQQSLFEQREQWIKEKPHSVLFKQLEQFYRKGAMLPYCPKCQQLFDYKDIDSHGNAEFYRRLEEKMRLAKIAQEKG